ncbi:Lrp/AsnC family transcriptional regulator [Phytomonospora endophytica]|uniref:Lrp/AsnC family leucine-responsive transcriptional regulator n=1 Tax=Phytomonospora endophytica TaxID=714109 RepID=A0A841FPR9_9ACTN|nr:Lrp/AsnC family transcriptional regulator [Phytomonospora endophytica]MBB6034559.1 Lrp/AsnC family leucine-responsive transcriptional regulator [Phytomonospora endophytica]GIG70469.1 AsnC family transcriptional regulator [Phytomonospora endophytica]
MKRELDAVDRTILREMTADGRQTVRALARTVGLSEPSVRDRLQRLEGDGVITGYRAELDPANVDAGTAAFIALRFDPAAKADVNERLAEEPCVLEVHEVAGEDCYWLKVRVSGTDALADALDRMRAIPSVRSTATTIVLRTILERPLGVAEG